MLSQSPDRDFVFNVTQVLFTNDTTFNNKIQILHPISGNHCDFHSINLTGKSTQSEIPIEQLKSWCYQYPGFIVNYLTDSRNETYYQFWIGIPPTSSGYVYYSGLNFSNCTVDSMNGVGVNDGFGQWNNISIDSCLEF